MFGYNQLLESFIVIEGIDGAGTSTQRQSLCQALTTGGRSVYDTWEPTEGPIGRLIRSALRAEIDLSTATIAHLFAADRCEHIEGANGIRAALKQGKTVVCDRYIFSSLAYQGMLLDTETVWRLNQGFPLPSILIFIDVDLETSAARRQKRGIAEEIYEKDQIQAQVRAGYRLQLQKLAEDRPDIRIGIFDGGKGINELHRDICGFVGIQPIQ